jgi:hypothetical protein
MGSLTGTKQGHWVGSGTTDFICKLSLPALTFVIVSSIGC